MHNAILLSTIVKPRVSYYELQGTLFISEPNIFNSTVTIFNIISQHYPQPQNLQNYPLEPFKTAPLRNRIQVNKTALAKQHEKNC